MLGACRRGHLKERHIHGCGRRIHDDVHVRKAAWRDGISTAREDVGVWGGGRGRRVCIRKAACRDELSGAREDADVGGEGVEPWMYQNPHGDMGFAWHKETRTSRRKTARGRGHERRKAVHVAKSA